MQGSFSYLFCRHSRLGSNVNLENERQHLVLQQKSSKARARKCLLETNRRRKALEERRKQWDIQEEQLRENILQQRRQQVQDATQRFQRAHLPPSQRYRQTHGYKATNIEEALSQIQSSMAWYNQNSTVLSATNTHSCPHSTKPPTDSKSSPRQVLCTGEAYTKLLEEQCTKDEGSQHSDSWVSESLSSKDSLENEDLNQSTLNLHSSYSSFFLDFENQRKQDDLNSTSVSAMMLLNPNPAKLRKFEEFKQENQENSNQWTNNNVVVSKTSLNNLSLVRSEKQTPNPDNPLTLMDHDTLTLSAPLNRDSEYLEVKSLMNSHSNNLLVTNEVGIVDTEAEALYPKEDASRSQRIHDGQFNYPSTQYNDVSDENIFLFETPMKKSTANRHPNDTALWHIEKEHFHLSTKKEICASINNFNKVSNLMYETEKPINAVLPSYTGSSNIQSKTEKYNGPKEEDKRLPISPRSICDDRFPKGILKKLSKYTSEDSCLHNLVGLTLTKHGALAIKDSIELTRAKTKGLVVNSTIKKKLRWFDEVLPEKAGKEQNKMKWDKDMSYGLFHPKNGSKDHHQGLTAEAESSKPGSKLTPTDSAGYHFTKEAWTDVGVQVNLPLQQADEVKALCTNTRTAGPKVPRRNNNANAVGGPVSSMTRKGTVIRPQSATEVSQIVKTQGKIMVPRPPPRSEPMGEKTACIIKTPYGTNHPSIEGSLAAQEAQCKNNLAQVFSSNSHHPVPADSTVMYTVAPDSYPCAVCPHSDSSVKGTPSSGQGTMNEKGICLHRTPTEEEILQLWHGVRSALNTKDAKPALKKKALESRRVCGKPCTEQSRQPPGSGSRRLLQSSQHTNQNSELVEPGPRNCNIVSQNEGLESATRLQMAEMHPEGLVKQNQNVAIMEKAQTQRPKIAQQGLTTLSFEEKKIMLSLDRLNHQLYCLKEHQEGRPGNNGQLIIGIPFTKEVKVSNNLKHRTCSANQLHYQKKM